MAKELQDKEFGFKTRCKQLEENLPKHLDRYDLYKRYNDYENFKDIMTKEEFDTVLKNRRNRSAKRYRANKKLKPARDMVNLNDLIMVFGTCTFNDKELNNQERTRTKKINLWLKKHFIYSIANIDYGSKTEREHQHFIGVLKPNEEIVPINKKSKKGNKMYNLKNQDYNLGFEPDLLLINTRDYEDIKLKKVSNYMLKRLNYHSNKSTTKSRRIRVIKSYKEI